MPLTWPDPQPDPTQASMKDADTRAVLLQEYSDRGQWARHYSAVRMTLGTFFITAATGVITLRWDSPQLAIAVFAGVVFLIGVFLFVVFSHWTFREMNGQFKIVDSYRQKLGAPPMRKPSGFSGITGMASRPLLPYRVCVLRRVVALRFEADTQAAESDLCTIQRRRRREVIVRPNSG